MATSRIDQVPPVGKFAPVSVPAAKRPRDEPDAATLQLQVSALEQDRRHVYQELFEAAQVQRRLSGPRQVVKSGFEIASEVFPVRHLAGDFVAAIEVGSQTWIALGDIEGKGLSAAMWFTHLVSLIQCHAAAEPRVARVMAKVNCALSGLQPSPPLTAMVMLVIDQQSREIEYCNAGHVCPVILRAGGRVERMETGGPLLGVLSKASYASATIELQPGDMLLGCSDGVLECQNFGDEEFGYARLLSQAREHASESARAILFSVLGAVQDFAGDTPRHDDLSVLVIRPAKERHQ